MTRTTSLQRIANQLSLDNLVQGSAGLLASGTIAGWMRTLDCRAYYHDEDVDPAHAIGGAKIYVFWHENILFPLFLRGHCRLAMLLSKHRDADLLARVGMHFGFRCVRGSTQRGGSSAVRKMFKMSQSYHLVITPDGPRGPRRHMAAGPIFLASKLKLPLVPMGFGYQHPWRAKSWDRFALPKPFSRARAIIGSEIHVPSDASPSHLEEYRSYVERLITQFSDEAEEWAARGTRYHGERTLRPMPAERHCLRAITDAANQQKDLVELARTTIPLPKEINARRSA